MGVSFFFFFLIVVIVDVVFWNNLVVIWDKVTDNKFEVKTGFFQSFEPLKFVYVFYVIVVIVDVSIDIFYEIFIIKRTEECFENNVAICVILNTYILRNVISRCTLKSWRKDKFAIKIH